MTTSFEKSLIDLTFDEINRISQNETASNQNNDNNQAKEEVREVDPPPPHDPPPPPPYNEDDFITETNLFSVSNPLSSIAHEESLVSDRQSTVKFNDTSLLKTPSIGMTSPTKSPQPMSTINSSVFVPRSNERFLTLPRKDPDTSTRCVDLKEARPVSAGELRKLRDRAVQPLDNKFDLIPLDDSEKQILNNYNLQMRVKDFVRNLERYDMQEAFEILLFPKDVDVESLLENSIPIKPLTKTKNLLVEWDTIEEYEIIRHVKFLRFYGQVWDLQNLDWSLELLEGSCAVNLTNKVREGLLSMPSELESGPMFFFLMMREIVSSSEDSLLSMITRIKTMKLSTFKGENVALMTGQIRMAVKRLRVMQRVPDELEKHILTALQTSSVGKFNAYFSQLEISLRQIPSFDLTPEKILKMADSLYREYLECGDWTSAKFTTPPNAFVTHDFNSNSRCPRCGKSHEGLCDQLHWKQIPPKEGEKENKVVNNRTWFWCGRCHRWNTTHSTTEHVRGKRNGTAGELPPKDESLNGTPLGSVSPPSFTSSTSLSGPNANVAQYDLSMLDTCRRTTFTSQFTKKFE